MALISETGLSFYPDPDISDGNIILILSASNYYRWIHWGQNSHIFILLFHFHFNKNEKKYELSPVKYFALKGEIFWNILNT